MYDINKLIENPEIVKENFEYEEKMRKVREQVSKKFTEYRTTLSYMAADAPIGTLCLPSAIENALLAHGLVRIYDLFDCDFTEVKGLGVRRIGDLTASLDKFFSML
jgi:hypothetical protein